MSELSIGDLALNLQSRLAHRRVKDEIGALSTELTSGITRDPARRLQGGLGALASLDHALTMLDTYDTAGAEAALFASSVQGALDTLRQTGETLGPALLQAGSNGHATLVDSAAADARARFSTIVSALNTSVAGRFLFAGTATDRAPLADAGSLLADLTSAAAAETDAAGVIAAVDAWFDIPGGGFDTVAYSGAGTALAPFAVGPGRTVGLDLTAADPGIRTVLKGYALAALVAEGTLSGDHGAQVALVQEAATRVMGADATLATLGARVGLAEASIDTARNSNASERAALELSRNELIAVDPYDAATALRAAETQLESLYAMTARLSRLSLAEYLR